MITVLNFCHKDRDMALANLQWLREIGACRNHEFFLQCNIAAAGAGMHQELHLLATEMFEKASFRVTDTEDERPWPFSANNAWRDFVYFSRTTTGKPWLWLEPDCTFIPKQGCPLCKIQHAYEACGKPFMGSEVTKPEHRMSGVGVYPSYVVGYTRRLPSLNPPLNSKHHAVAWDQYLAGDIVPNAAFTNLIQHVWNVELGKPETIPTFPTHESLSLIHPEALLFHRVKNGSLIDRLRENRGVPSTTSATSIPNDFSPEVYVAAVKYCQPSKESEMQAEIDRLKAQLLQQRNGGDAPLSQVTSTPGTSNAAPTSKPEARRKQRMKVIPKRTTEQQAAINARMEKARSARKVAT